MTSIASPRVDDLQFEAVYEQYFGFLVQIAVFKFRVRDVHSYIFALRDDPTREFPCVN